MHREPEVTREEESLDTESLLSEDHPSEKQLLRPQESSTRARRNTQLKTCLHAAAILFYTVLTIALYSWSVRLRTVRSCACETGIVSCKS